MFRKGIDLESAIDYREENLGFPMMWYFIKDNVECNCPDGSVDGVLDDDKTGLINGVSSYDELIFDESVRESDDAFLIMCEKILSMGGVVYIALGLTEKDDVSSHGVHTKEFYSKEYLNDEYSENHYYNHYTLFNDRRYALVVMEDELDKPGYDRGTFGIYIKKGEDGDLVFDYGYQTLLSLHCFSPTIEDFYFVSDDDHDEYEQALMYLVNKMLIFD